MVVMAVALAIVSVLAFSMVGAKRPCDGVDPAIRSFTLDFVNNKCLYIRQKDNEWEGAKKECESMGQYPHKWRLVELKNERVQAAFHRIMAAKAGGREYLFWMGLAREDRDGSSQNAWANPSKWRWQSDSSTLLSWSSSQVPWARNEPSGWSSSNPELCVMVYGRPNPQQRPIYWMDAPCSGHQLGHHQFLVCESMDVSTTTTSSTTTTTTTTTTTAPTIPETNSSCPCLFPTTPVTPESETNPWMWVAIVEMFIIIGAVVTFLAYRAYQHHQYRKRKPYMLTADSDQSGKYENMPQFKGKRRPMKKEDESESKSLDTSMGSKMKRLEPKKPKLSWMKDRKSEPKAPVPVQQEWKKNQQYRNSWKEKPNRYMKLSWMKDRKSEPKAPVPVQQEWKKNQQYRNSWKEKPNRYMKLSWMKDRKEEPKAPVPVWQESKKNQQYRKSWKEKPNRYMKLSWMTDRKDEPKSPVPVQPDGKAAVSKQPEGKAKSKSLKTAVMKRS